MKDFSCAYWFVAGLFVSSALLQSILPALLFAILLILFWATISLPLIMAIFIDTVFVHERTLHNAYGFSLTVGIIVLILIVLPVRKFLKF